MKTQSGSAAIWFVFVAFAILGMGALGVEGSRYITEKAHLGDAMEATAIAVSESDNIRGNSSKDKFDENKAKSIATAWVNYLVPDNKASTFNVSREKREEIIVPGGKVKRTVYHYKIDSSITQKSWMHMNGVPSFGETQTVYNKATAARIRTDFEPVDVVFVADFSGSMKQHKRLYNLKKSIRSVTETIFSATQKLKINNKDVNDSSFGFIPFTKRIVVEKNGKYYCSSMLRSNPGTDYWRPMKDILLSDIATGRKENSYWGTEWWVMDTYVKYARSGSGSWVMPLDCNHGEWHWSKERGWFQCRAPYGDHIDYHYTANNLQLSKNYELSTPIEMRKGSRLRWSSYCSDLFNSKPRYHNIDRVELKQPSELHSFNRQVEAMARDSRGRENPKGGTDMYQGLLAAPGQFEGATNKNRFIFVLSDGAENNSSFKKLVDQGLCKTLRKELSTNEQGEHVKFEMFVIGLKFKNNDQAYKDCFGKHIYSVDDLKTLKDVIMELLSNTTSYNVER
ncbi:pilus assembly protein [Vibrio europaeus]|uniref:pilus assembly protein n=1 Tax=Vibrio europaeus TaxID=300876 RepID=UPI00233F36B3|nr:pilus assembly protein [Vibrio europaeus]MDC5818718.1 pilus assembly protein [Vibrio europaeus]MDC5871260.1 pilus assembly protein [Vibrio europaeus]